MTTLTLDIETYYDGQFSLRSMPMQQYILDPLFEVIGVSVQVDDGKPQWFSGDFESTLEFLQTFPWETSMLIAHNAHFDAGIMNWIFGIVPQGIFCTMMGARPFLAPFTKRGSVSLANLADHLNLVAKGGDVANARGLRRVDFGSQHLATYGEYCDHDVELCYAIYKVLAPRFTPDEAQLLDMTIRKFTEPQLELNSGLLQEALVRIKLIKQSVLGEAGLENRDLLMSNDKFAEALRNLGVEPPTKISPRTGKEAYAFAKTDAAMKALTNHSDPKVAVLAEARLMHKSTLEETRTERLLALSGVGKLFGVPLIFYGAHTGRYSGTGKLNLQNLSRGSELRAAIGVPYGMKLIAGDLSQIEARMVACLAGQEDLVQAFADGEDVYCLFASDVYGHAVDKSMEQERFVGKQGILQLGYAAGHMRFQLAMSQFGIIMDEYEAKRIVTLYRKTYSEIPKLWKEADKWIKHMISGDIDKPYTYGPLTIYREYGLERAPAILLPNGMPMYYPELIIDVNNDRHYKSRDGWKKIYGGAMIENVCQALARIVVVGAELTLHEYNIITCNQIHDEIHVVAPVQYADKYKKIMELALTKRIEWMPNLPLACEVGIGDNYKEAH